MICCNIIYIYYLTYTYMYININILSYIHIHIILQHIRHVYTSAYKCTPSLTHLSISTEAYALGASGSVWEDLKKKNAQPVSHTPVHIDGLRVS
jgi:hypothetical protein